MIAHGHLESLDLGGDPIRAALDWECADMPEADRSAALERAMREIAVPFLVACASRKGARELKDKGKLDYALITLSAQRLLGADAPNGNRET